MCIQCKVCTFIGQCSVKFVALFAGDKCPVFGPKKQGQKLRYRTAYRENSVMPSDVGTAGDYAYWERFMAESFC